MDSDASYLWQMIEMMISMTKDEVMLKNQSRDPHIVGWNRRTLLPQLPVDDRVVMGLFVRPRGERTRRPSREIPEGLSRALLRTFQLRILHSIRECDEWHVNRFCVLVN